MVYMNDKIIIKELVKIAKKLESDYNDPHTIVITGKGDGMIDIANMIDYIKHNGNIGHSFEIIVDPNDSERKKIFGWDGDGADRLDSVKLDDKEIE